MSDDLKMYVAMGIFMALPVGIMVLAYLSDRFDRWLSTTDRPTDHRPFDR